ncbi:MAG: 30S ribosomal protein S9 [Candidatus Micrarchaeota archaeon]
MDEKTIVKKKKKAKGITAKAKKKTAVARAVIRQGKGVVRINKRNLLTFQPRQIQEFIMEPLEIAAEKAKEVSISINVNGGGFMTQAVAARSAIAKALVLFFKDEKLKKKMLAYDRLLLVDDVRRKESKKQLGTGARRRKQKSKR